ncbi:DUF3945 domain-containing protein [Hymenobacter sp. BT683]|uniref:DUF3945 domain-containing protein n=1 Tax=Hymenobacter jeongseonensis TaxID=2791027 RepID=A0ABS0IQ38_9BACT|nr:DUF3945 domain-containing protein [Hymenobacter jeongseonensis]MBF9239870.1 DUF3945 domain-containing protein [Hymenobacter jeongseonensis]
MAEQDENPTPAPLYLSQLPIANGNIAGNWLELKQAPHSLFQVQLNPANPNQAALLPAPGADETLMSSYTDTLGRVYQLVKIPSQTDQYVRLERPTLLEKIGDNWKVVQQGRVGFSPNAQEPFRPVFGEPAPMPAQDGKLSQQGVEPEEKVATARWEQEPAVGEEGVKSQRREQVSPGPVKETPPTVQPAPTEPVGEGKGPQRAIDLPPAPIVAEPTLPEAPRVAGPPQVGDLQIQWQQQGAEVAPLLEMRAYLGQLREAGVAVGALQLERDPAGKLRGGFGVSYDPGSHQLGQLEATLQGFRQVGHGVAVVEKPAQAAVRRQAAGYGSDYESPRSQQVRQAFGASQWDALSAQLSAVPKHALTGPEQVQQAAAGQRVQQVAQRQGKTSEQVIRNGKSIFDIDTSGNPASAFLKIFYAHLNGGPKTRQSLEVDYEQTRQELQARLTRQAGPAQPNLSPQPLAAAATKPSRAAGLGAEDAKAAATPPKPAARRFQYGEVPRKVLASLGLNLEILAASGQLQKLLKGEKTDLLPMQVAGREGREPVKFEGKMVLHREADGSATLQMELPQEKLVVPNEIGGQPFTSEQRQRLETDGHAGLVRGLKDEQGREYNGYVAVDKAMNKVVVMPETRVTLHDTVAGVKLTPEQSHDLREGKVVALSNMASGPGCPSFDGTVRVNAPKACLEVRPAARELTRRLDPRPGQAIKATSPVTTAAPAAQAPPSKQSVVGPKPRLG